MGIEVLALTYTRKPKSFLKKIFDFPWEEKGAYFIKEITPFSLAQIEPLQFECSEDKTPVGAFVISDSEGLFFKSLRDGIYVRRTFLGLHEDTSLDNLGIAHVRKGDYLSIPNRIPIRLKVLRYDKQEIFEEALARV